IGSFVVLILLVLNLNIMSHTTENLNTNFAQRDLTTTVWIIEYDLFKIGYRVTGNKIEIADSNEIKFYSDFNNNGTIDSIHYYLGNVSVFGSTPNPLDRPLYRKENNNSNIAQFPVVDFALTYSDSIGNDIDYALLSSPAVRNTIRTIKVKLKVESNEPINGIYQVSQWEKKITPKNLR
ncbi:MAG: hypothetical protein O6940_12495, partial [Ignavibacteria bacterium]|nr:hypothetical protein [Ignavibacteria bacterium]